MILSAKLVASIIRDAVIDANNKEQEAAMFFFGKRAELLLTNVNLEIESVRQKLGLPAEWWSNTNGFIVTATATTEPRIKLWHTIFGTDTIPLTTPAPFSVKTDKTNRDGEHIYEIAYQLNTKALSKKQRYKLINYLAQTTTYTLAYIIKNIDDGLPIKAENIIVSIINQEKGVSYHNDYASRASTKIKKKQSSKHRRPNEKTSNPITTHPHQNEAERGATSNPDLSSNKLATISNKRKRIPV